MFYERMQMTAEFEELLQTLYRDFLALRLSSAWDAVVTTLLRKWVLGVELDIAEYELLRRPPVTAVSDVLELKTGAAMRRVIRPRVSVTPAVVVRIWRVKGDGRAMRPRLQAAARALVFSARVARRFLKS